MGNSLFKRLWGKQEVRVLFLGLDASGKTTTLYRLKLGEVVTTIPTIGFNVETVEHNNVQLTASDTGGRNKIRPMNRHYYQNTQGLVFLMDSNDKERFEDAKEELMRFASEDELLGIPILILANKQDLPGALTAEEVRDKLGENLYTDRAWAVFGVSANYGDKVSSTGLKEAFDWLTDAMVTKEKYHVMRKWMPSVHDDNDKYELEKENSSYIGTHALISVGHHIGYIGTKLSIVQPQ